MVQLVTMKHSHLKYPAVFVFHFVWRMSRLCITFLIVLDCFLLPESRARKKPSPSLSLIIPLTCLSRLRGVFLLCTAQISTTPLSTEHSPSTKCPSFQLTEPDSLNHCRFFFSMRRKFCLGACRLVTAFYRSWRRMRSCFFGWQTLLSYVALFKEQGKKF